MKIRKMQVFYSLLTMVGMFASIFLSQAAETTANTAVPVRMTVTASVANDERLPEINRGDVLTTAMVVRSRWCYAIYVGRPLEVKGRAQSDEAVGRGAVGKG
jgi:hypothetical protein